MNPASPSAVIAAGALSPDGYFYWDGVAWKATLSADGAWRWNGAAWVPTGQAPVASYESPRILGLCVLLGACVVVAFFQVFVFDAYERVWLGLGDLSVYYTFDLVGLTSFLITSALFLAWFRRAYRNAAVLGAGDLKFSSGWAVGWWFVPIACFWMPYRASVDVWRASAPVALATTGDQPVRADPKPTLIRVWWVTWLLCVAAVNVDAVVYDPTSGPNVLWLLANASVAVASIASIAVVRSVTKRQHSRWRQLASIASAEQKY